MTFCPRVRTIELVVGTAAVILATLAFLLASTPLGVLALVVGAIGYGIVLAREPT